MTTTDVANRLVDLCRKGKYEQALTELYSPDIISVEAEGSPDRITKGIQEVIKKGIEFQSKILKVNSSYVSDPIVADNFFSCSIKMNVDMQDAPVPVDINEICVYNVENGKIIREEFFYPVPPRQA